MNLSQQVLAIVNSIQEYNQPANNYTNPGCTGIKIGNESPQEEQTPTGEQGYDTVCPRLGDIDRAATISQYCQQESLDIASGIAYYATTEGEARKAEKQGVLRPSKTYRAYASKSNAVEHWTNLCKMRGLKVFGLVSLRRDKINRDGTFTEPVRVLGVEYFSTNDLRSFA